MYILPETLVRVITNGIQTLQLTAVKCQLHTMDNSKFNMRSRRTDKPDLTHDGNLRVPVGFSTMGLLGSHMKAYGNKTALLKCALKSIMDPPPPGGLNVICPHCKKILF